MTSAPSATNGGPGVALGFLAAETAAHARGFDDDSVFRQAEDFGDDGLDLGRVLGGAADVDAAFAVGLGPGGLGFQIEMVLAADVEFAFEQVRAFGEGGFDFAADEEVGIGVIGIGGDGLRDAEDGWERGVFDFDQCGGEAAGFEGIADDGGDELAVELDECRWRRAVRRDGRGRCC